MKVISKLANLDFEVGTIRREGNRLVITSAEGKGIPTVVHMAPKDALSMLKAAFSNTSALGFIFLFPLYYYRASKEKTETKANINNPWS